MIRAVSLLALLLSLPRADAQQISIGVLGLFHSREVIVTPFPGHPLECGSLGNKWTQDGPLHVVLQDDQRLSVVSRRGISQIDSLHCGAPAEDPEFRIALPGKISRTYRGGVRVTPKKHELVIGIQMELETAVASVVAAESAPGTPAEALKALAVVSRSFLWGGKGRHGEFDFCDTTHCQFLREPPKPGAPAYLATQQTHGLVLAYRGKAFAAMYSASCGGRTHSLDELGLKVRDYPYFAVECKFCRKNPQRWVSRLSAADAEGLNRTEQSRLKLARRLGWKTIPSNSYSIKQESNAVLLEGTGEGHGLGLCERGAAAMARMGATFDQVLDYYYPNTTVEQLP